MILASNGIIASSITNAAVSPLLDLYPSAAAAFSVRKLRTAYTGSAIRVRRSSDNTEQDIGFSGNDLDTSALTTFVGANNGFVTTFYDQSGNARNATQATASNQPQIVVSGTVLTQGGKPIMKFTSSSQVLNTTSFSLSANRTYVVTLWNETNVASNYKSYLAYVGTDNNTNGITGLFGQSNIAQSFVGSGAANNSVGTTAMGNSTYFLLESYVQGSSQHQHYRNGALNAQNASLTISPSATSRQYGIMASGANGSDIRTNEAIIWDSYESSNRTGIETNINTYYNIYQTLLLDLYPSAAVAYSLRKLRNDYSGSAIRVRRSSDNTEQDIGFSGGNLDTSALTTFCSGTDGFVTTWYDQSGNFLNAIQTTAVNQPQIVSSGTILTENSKPSLRFNGSYMIISSVLLNSTNLSCYYVTLPKTTYTFGGILTNKTSGSDDANAINFLNNGKIDMVYNGTHAFITQLNTQTSLFQGTALWNTTNIILRTNSVQDGTVAKLGGQTFSTQTWMGSYRQQTTNLGNFSMSEVILYQSNQSANNLNIENNLKAYYGT